jgi:lysophospholipase L1-like esterase
MIEHTGPMPLRRLAVLVAALAAVAGCSTSVASGGTGPAGAATVPAPGVAAPAPAAAPTSVAMIGDSITEASEMQLEEAFAEAGFQEWVIEGESGRRIAVGNGRGEPLAGTAMLADMLEFGVAPDVWVIALGTNDVGQYSTSEEYAALVDGMLDQLPEDVPVVWVDAYVGPRLEETLEWNVVLRDRVGEREHTSIAEWTAVADGDGVLSDDDYHPSEEGHAVFAEVVASAAADAR